jgi:hypothetical protein
MGARIDDSHLMAGFRQMPANHRAGQSGPHHQKPARHIQPFPTCPCLVSGWIADQPRQENRPSPELPGLHASPAIAN